MNALETQTARIAEIVAQGNTSFLVLGGILNQLESTYLESGLRKPKFFHFVKRAGVDRRYADYCMSVEKAFRTLHISHERLQAIGLAKLLYLFDIVDAGNVQALLEAAEAMTEEELAKHVLGEKEPTFLLKFKLSGPQLDAISGTLLANGAYLTGAGNLANKEAALMKVCATIQRAWAAGIT